MFSNFQTYQTKEVTVFTNQQLTIRELKEAHVFFLEKIIPEIELHFLTVAQQCTLSEKVRIQAYLIKFYSFTRALSDHILMEEQFIFPFLAGKSLPSEKEAVIHFIEHHEDFEQQLQALVTELVNELSELNHLMAFRMLALKLHRFNEKLLEHALLEESLF
jgi:iron-sulfur cluster repair protein YtfE (RIC family)